jgi:hypothetical protein
MFFSNDFPCIEPIAHVEQNHYSHSNVASIHNLEGLRRPDLVQYHLVIATKSM